MRLSEVRLRQALFTFVLGGALVITGCSSTGPKNIKDAGEGISEPAKAAAAPGEGEHITVEYINVVGEGDRVLIGTTGAVRYTVFKLSDPARLIVDMPGVALDKVVSPIAVGNDFLKEITAVSYGDEKDIGRVIINLNEGIDHEVKSGENSILVSLKKADFADQSAAGSVMNASASDAVTTEDIPAEPAVEPEKSLEESAPQASVEQAVEAGVNEAAAPATKVLRIEASKEGENTVLKVVTDGPVGNYTSFELNDPARIVIDIWGVGNSLGRDVVPVKGKHIKTVRIGSHAGKARLVFDAPGKKIAPHAITTADNALILTLGPKVVASTSASVPNTAYAKKAQELGVAHVPAPESAAVAPVEAPAAAEAPAAVSQPPVAEGVKVESIDFKKAGDKGRLTIVSSEKVEYKIKESKDGKTVVLDIKGATIPESLVRTLDAAKLKTPVASISSYQQSLDPKEVRVLVKLAGKASYKVVESGQALTLEFAEQAQAAETAAQALSEKDDSTEGKAAYTGRRIDLDMMDANIADVIRLLAEVSNLNIITSDDVKGTISLRLKNVPWDQAFDIILKSKDLDSIKEGNVVRVAPALKIRQEQEAGLASRKAQEKLEDLEIEFVLVNYATAEELIKQVKSALTDRGDVTSDKRTNTLIIKDLKSGIESAKNVIKKLDTPIPQVLIEARIVEASSSFARDLGIQWGVDYQTGGNVSTNTFGSSATTGQSLAATTTAPTFSERAGAQNFAVSLPASGTAGTLGALGFILGKAGVNPLVLDLRLSAGESQGQLKTISRPRITTMDNKEAKIEQGESIPFETTSASGTSTMFIDANLSLTVTPHITPDGSVLMKIKASRNSIGTFRTSGGQPSINKKESTTDVLVKDGETTVIGGIVITDKNDSEKGIPLLKDIPVIGWLFKSKSVSDTQTELLIFITPKIIKDKVVI